MLKRKIRFRVSTLALLVAVASLSPIVDAQGKGKPGGGGGGGGCPSYGIPTSDNSVVGGLPGNLDGTFGIGGVLAVPPSNSLYPVVTKIAVQQDGKIVLFGVTQSGPETVWDLFVTRLHADGSADTSFGTSGPGYTAIDFINANDYPGNVAVLSNGKIIVGGHINYSGGGTYESVVAQLNSDGSLDTTFGVDGKLEIYINSPTAPKLTLEDIVEQPDGKIILAGSDSRFTAVRIHPDGSLDTTFGSGGFASATPVSSGSGFGASSSVALQSSGRIVLGGWSKKKSTDKEAFTLVAFTSSGQLDGSFGSSGRASAVFSEGASRINDIAVDTSNGTVAVGVVDTACGGGSDSAFARFTAAGALDNSFSSDGKHVQEVYGGLGSSLAVSIQPDGKIVASGAAGKSDTSLPQDLSLIRFNTNGTLDASFGPGLAGFFPSGIVTLRTGPIGASGRGLAIHDGRIITGGSFGSNRVIARYVY